MKFVVAIDVGGTSIKAALLNSDLQVLDRASAPTPTGDNTGQLTASAIKDIVQTFALTHEISAIGLAVPGALDEVAGTSRWSGNLGWKDIPIRDLLAEAVGVPVAFGHDVRAGALAEHRMGAAAGFANSIFIPIGTGIAAALIIDNEIRSSNGFAGEIGHLRVGHKTLCVCGKFGCLEAISSASAIARTYETRSGKVGASSAEIFDLVTSGDLLATEVWNEAVDYLAIACESLITILAPEVIVFGGGLSLAGESLISPLQEKLERALTFQRAPLLRIAHFSTQSGTIGSALMALDLIAGKGNR